MRTLTQLMLCSAVVLAAGCDAAPSGPSAGVLTGDETTQVKQAKQAVTTAKDYAYQVRGEFIKDMEDELTAMKRTLQQLSDKVARTDHAAKADAKARLVAVGEKVTQLNNALEKAKHAPETGWDQMKADYQKSNQNLKDSVAQARTWLSEKIAP